MDEREELAALRRLAELEAKAGGGMPQGTANRDVAAQAGLGLRSAIKGAMAIPSMGADAIGGLANFAQDKFLGSGRGVRFQQTLPALDGLMDRAGLPRPDTALQNIVAKGVEIGTGAGAAARLSSAAAQGAQGATREVLQRLGSNPAAQIAGGVGAGTAGQHSAETGGNGFEQFVSSMLGGIGGGGAVMGLQGAARRLGPTPQSMQPMEMERRIMVALERQGIDPKSVTPALKKSLMEDATKALKLGEGTLDDGALARLSDYRRLNLEPTRGRMTLDPYDVTREQNAMRMAAATGNRDARLPQIAQGNNRGLLGAVDDFSPTDDTFRVGSSAQAPILARDAALKARTDSLYSQARDTAGRSAPLDGATFTRDANQRLQQNLAPKLGDEVDRALNDIATGKTPLTVEYAEQLKTMLGRKAAAAKGTNGDLAYAYGLVRQALDDTPLMPSRGVNPGNLPAVPGTVPTSTPTIGKESIDAFNAARSSAKERFGWQESAQGIAKTLDGAPADTFLQNSILSRSVGLKDAAAVAREISTDPQALEATRAGIVQVLKDAAIGKGNQSATGNFSGRGWSSALSNIGDRKMSLFFSPEELEQLKAIGRVGTAETFQPRGSAVNNSNTAAGVGSLLQGVSKFVKPMASKLPLGQQALIDPLDNITLSFMERGATNVPQGLLMRNPAATRGSPLLDPLLLPLATSGGLLSVPQ